VTIACAFLSQRFPIAWRKRYPPIGFEKVLDEEIHFPGQLLHVEAHPVGQVLRIGKLASTPLNRVDVGDRLAVQGRMPRR
jgi:hypothetical protein